MPYVDVLSFECHSEQEPAGDEVYVQLANGSDDPSQYSPIYVNVNANDKINVDVPALEFTNSAGVYLWESDGGGDADDFIGGTTFHYDQEHIGVHTITVQGSGGDYDLTYEVWA